MENHIIIETSGGVITGVHLCPLHLTSQNEPLYFIMDADESIPETPEMGIAPEYHDEDVDEVWAQLRAEQI